MLSLKHTDLFADITCSLDGRQPSGDWRSDQNQRIQAIAQNISQQIRSNQYSNEIFLFVHGFNVTYTSATCDFSDQIPDATDCNAETGPGMYAVAREKVLAQRDSSKPPIFVRVFFDGGRHSNGADAGAAWLKAQSAAPAVGFRLRLLFNEIHRALVNNSSNPDQPNLPALKILTHSTGAVVIGSLFGDARGALPCLRDGASSGNNRPLRNCSADYDEFRSYLNGNRPNDYGVPQFPDTRIVMLAPATPPSTFTGIYNRTKFSGFQLGPEHTLVVSYRPEDKVLTKTFAKFLGVLPLNWRFRSGGDTRLGADKISIENLIQNRQVEACQKGTDNRTFAVSMSTHLSGLDTHSVVDYMESEGFEKDALEIWLSEEPPVGRSCWTSSGGL